MIELTLDNLEELYRRYVFTKKREGDLTGISPLSFIDKVKEGKVYLGHSPITTKLKGLKYTDDIVKILDEIELSEPESWLSEVTFVRIYS